jgi:hypothetical protein
VVCRTARLLSAGNVAQYPGKNTRNVSSTDCDVEAQHNQKWRAELEMEVDVDEKNA